MATAKAKVGGKAARLYIESLANEDMVTIPKGFMIKKVTFRRKGTNTGKLRIGSTFTAAVKHKLSVTFGGATAGGDISITLFGQSAVLIPVLVGDDLATEVTAKVLAASFPGWTVTSKDGDELYFERNTPGYITGTPFTFAANGTGVTATPVQVTAGTNIVSGVEVVASTAYAGADGVMQNFNIVASGWNVDKTLYIGSVELASGDTTGDKALAAGSLILELYKPF